MQKMISVMLPILGMMVMTSTPPTMVDSFSFVATSTLSAYDRQYRELTAPKDGQSPAFLENSPEKPPSVDEATHNSIQDERPIILEGDDQRHYELSLTVGKESTSGKSAIVEAWKGDQPVIAKISANREQLQREVENFRTVTDDGMNEASDLFVELYDYLEDPVTDEIVDAEDGSGAIIMESGSWDLRAYLQKNGPMRGEELREAVKTMSRAAKAIHDSNMVWTELKAENFVVKEEGLDTIIKGIDLESAVEHKEHPLDFTPEACPPEFAMEYLCGREQLMKMEYHFDVWSLGMLLYELATGKPYFRGKDDHEIISDGLRSFEQVDLDDMPGVDEQFKDLVRRCLQVNPDERPSMSEILEHPYLN